MVKLWEKIANFFGLYEDVEVFEEEIEQEKAKAKDKVADIRRAETLKNSPAIEELPWLKPKNASSAASGKSKVISLPTANKQVKVILVAPRIFDDVQIIADHVKAGKPVVINFEDTEDSVMKRIIDFISGTAYALNGNVKMVGKSMVCAPNNVDIDVNSDFTSGKDFGPWRQ
jgi:cell division inhibitor SepF